MINEWYFVLPFPLFFEPFSHTQLINNIAEKLFSDIVILVNESRNRVAIRINSEITTLYWNIGKLINNAILNNKRAEYGEQIVATVSQQLMAAFGKGFTKSALNRMINFYLAYKEEQNIATLSQELSWSHFVEWLDKYERKENEETPIG